MKPKTWKVLEMAVENGVAYGYQQAYKHLDNPSEEAIKVAIQQAVVNEIAEWFEIESESGD